MENFLPDIFGHFIIVESHSPIRIDVSNSLVVSNFFFQPDPHSNSIAQVSISKVIRRDRCICFLTNIYNLVCFCKGFFFLDSVILCLFFFREIPALLDQI